jgi:NAD(P)-dependent dehydrogenase (short-subunit alcohol dehydrogenase family)
MEVQNASRKKTWLVTGASTGFGRELTEQALAAGDRVAATLRTTAALDELVSHYGDRLWTAALDVTDASAVRAVVARAFETMGRIDVVVNNAGFGLFGAAEEVTDDQVMRQIQTNLVGSIDVIRAVLPALRAQGGGRILQVSSEGGQIAYPNFSIYHATKWGIEGFVESVAREVAPFGIEFTLIEPGPTKTSFGSRIVRPPALAIYDETPSGDMRRTMAAGTLARYGDVVGSVRAMIASVDRRPAPRRVPLGADTFDRVRAALVARIVDLDRERDLALLADAEA